MDILNKLSAPDKQFAVVSAVVIGGLLLWSASTQTGLPMLITGNRPVAIPDAQKSGFPAQENMADYQPAVESNAGALPSYSTNSAFGK